MTKFGPELTWIVVPDTENLSEANRRILERDPRCRRFDDRQITLVPWDHPQRLYLQIKGCETVKIRDIL